MIKSKIEWMNHTGFVIKDMERSLSFYRDLLGFTEERNAVLEGEYVSQLVGYEDARLHVVYLGLGDMKHAVELLQYLNPAGLDSEGTNLNTIGAAHLGIIVEDVDSIYRELLRKGIRFVNPPITRPDAQYPWARKACYLQDPDGNWLEFIERSSPPEDATVV